jgi:hypothetical protein
MRVLPSIIFLPLLLGSFLADAAGLNTDTSHDNDFFNSGRMIMNNDDTNYDVCLHPNKTNTKECSEAKNIIEKLKQYNTHNTYVENSFLTSSNYEASCSAAAEDLKVLPKDCLSYTNIPEAILTSKLLIGQVNKMSLLSKKHQDIDTYYHNYLINYKTWSNNIKLLDGRISDFYFIYNRASKNNYLNNYNLIKNTKLNLDVNTFLLRDYVITLDIASQSSDNVKNYNNLTNSSNTDLTIKKLSRNCNYSFILYDEISSTCKK